MYPCGERLRSYSLAHGRSILRKNTTNEPAPRCLGLLLQSCFALFLTCRLHDHFCGLVESHLWLRTLPQLNIGTAAEPYAKSFLQSGYGQREGIITAS